MLWNQLDRLTSGKQQQIVLPEITENRKRECGTNAYRAGGVVRPRRTDCSNQKGGTAMSRTYKDSRKGSGRERHISVRAVRRNPPDLRRLSRALIALAMAQADADARAEAAAAETANKQPSDETPSAPPVAEGVE